MEILLVLDAYTSSPFAQTPSVPPAAPPASQAAPTIPPGRPSVGPGAGASRNHHRRYCPPPSPANGSISSNSESTEAPERPTPGGGGVLGFLKGSAGHLIKNIRETSSRVMEAMTA